MGCTSQKLVDSQQTLDSADRSVTYNDLEPSSTYKIGVSFIHDKFKSGLTELLMTTNPSFLADPVMNHVTKFSASAKIDIRDIVFAEFTQAKSLVVVYSKKDSTGKNAIPGSTST